MSYHPDDKPFHIEALVDVWNMPQCSNVVNNKVFNTFPTREEWVGIEEVLCFN